METQKWFKDKHKRYSTPIAFIDFPVRNLLLFTAICFALFMTSMARAEGVIALPQTGQAKCYDTNGAVITCAGTGQDGDIKAGAIWPSVRFSFGTGAESDCMIDNLTGLMWPKNGNLMNGTKTWNQAIDYPKTLTTLCGYSDWRLPNINELESLVNAGESDPAAWLSAQGFSSVNPSDYWSSTTYVSDTAYTWSVDMGSGVWSRKFKTANGYVWPVRAGQSGSLGNAAVWKTGQITSYRTGDDGDLKQGVPWPSPRFIDNSSAAPADLTVTDMLTGHIWTKDANTPGPYACSPAVKKTWQEALDYVKCLNTENYLGHTDWRLPNRKELRSLADYSKTNPVLVSEHPFSNVQPDYYWSSTSYAYLKNNSWNVDMRYGYAYWIYKGVPSSYYVWPIRAGRTGSFSLIISRSGIGSGTVTSNPAGINCGSDCIEYYSSGTSVVLDASPASGSAFTGWSGACTNASGACTVTMDAAKTVTATFGNSTQSYTLNFLSGWSLISFPLQSTDMSIVKVLSDISDNCVIVWEFTNPGTWKSYIPADYDPGDTSAIHKINTDKGYWMKTKKASNLVITGNQISSKTIRLAPGWNLVGFKQTTDAASTTLLQGIASSTAIVWEFTPPSTWKSYIPADYDPGDTSAIHKFIPGKGYWIKTNTIQPIDWTQ